MKQAVSLSLRLVADKIDALSTLQFSFLMFVALSVTQESDDLFRVFYFLGMAPATLLLIVRDRALSGLWRNTLFVLSVLLVTWVYLSVYWSNVTNLTHVAVRHTRWWLATLFFFVGMAIYAYNGLHKRRIHGWILQATVILAALIAIGLYHEQHRYPLRITGLGLLDEIISGASLLIMLWVISLPGLDLRQRRDTILAFLGLVLVSTYCFLNQSRAPLGVIVFIWVGLFFGVIRDAKLRWALLGVTVAAVGVMVFMTNVHPLLESMMVRGGSFRLELWQVALSHLNEYVWFGVGVATPGANTPMGQDFKVLTGHMLGHPHNLFLSMWMFAGLPAFLMTVLLFVWALYLAFKLSGTERAIFLMAVVALLGLCFTAPARLIASPQVLHLLFWTPLGLLCGSYMAQQNGTAKR